jgi:hypothetical protein
MGIGEFFAFIKALPEIVKLLGRVASALESLKLEYINKQLDDYRADVSQTLKQIEGATSNEERKRLTRDLAARMSR